MVSLKYLGHSCFLIDFGDVRVLIDPYLKILGSSAAEELKRIDIVLVTHEHLDHMDKETIQNLAEGTFSSVVAPRTVLRELHIPDKCRVDVRVGDKFELKGVQIEVLNAVHPQSVYPVGYVIKAHDKSFYHAGDTYEFTGMLNIKADIALLPIGGTYTMDPISAEKAAKEIQCKYVIPMHYGTFPDIDQSAEEFAQGLKNSKVKPIVLKPGQEINV